MAEERLTDYMEDGDTKLVLELEQQVAGLSATSLIGVFLELLEVRADQATRHAMRCMAKSQHRKSRVGALRFRMQNVTQRLMELDSILSEVNALEVPDEIPEQPRKRNHRHLGRG